MRCENQFVVEIYLIVSVSDMLKNVSQMVAPPVYVSPKRSENEQNVHEVFVDLSGQRRKALRNKVFNQENVLIGN